MDRAVVLGVSDANTVPVCCDEERAECVFVTKAVNLPVHLYFDVFTLVRHHEL